MDAIVASVINNSSLNCRTNSSSSSISSGYASGQSAASTPATPISSHYDTSTHTTMTSASSAVSSTDQLPTATVAPVMPFYSETSLGQQQRQNYYQSYPFTNSSAQYNPVYDAYTGNSYHNLTTPSVERNMATGSGRHISSSTYHKRAEKQQKPLPAYSASAVGSQHYGTTSTASASTPSIASATTTKPQATATQFFAQPRANVNTTAATYYDAYGKYKLPSTTKLTSQTVPDYATNYTNHLQHAAAAATFSYQQQQQHYYAAAKSQLQDVGYVGAVVKPHRQTNIGNSTAYYNSGSAYYDKYMYAPTPNAAAYSAPPQNAYPPHEPSSVDPYRSNRISAPWKMDYAAASVGNCRNLPYVGNSGSYLSTPSATGNGRDSFCAAATDKYDKYDKYNAYYSNAHHPQQYIQSPSPHSAISGPSAATRSLWSNTAHQTPPHLATSMTTVIPHSLSPSAPTPHQYPHTHTHSNTHHAFSPTATNTTTQRAQSCCTQPFQQQSCYFPRATQQYPHVAIANAYAPQATQPTQCGTITGSSAHKYAAFTGTYKSNSSNDLYLSSPFDPPPPQAYNYNGPTTAAITQRYGGMATTNSPFYNNDLNVQPGFGSYSNNTHAMSPTSVMSQNVAVAHQSTHHLSYQQTYGHTSQSNGATDLLEYRKPLSSAETSTVNDFSMNSTHITQHVADTPSYDIHGNPIAQAHAIITSPSIYCDGNSSSEKSTPNTKNLSLRDFLATWNEEEEEDLNTSASEQLSYISENTEISQYISDSRSEIAPLTTSVPNSSEHSFQQSKDSYQAHPKIHVGIPVDESTDVEAAASQCINLPDIIIDIEKTNNAGTTIPPTASTRGTESTLEHHRHSPCGGTHELFENFDVEKELDELQLKRAKMCLEKQLNNEIRILTPEPIESLNQQLVENISSKDQAEVEQHHNTTFNIQHTECEKLYHNPETFLEEIELNDDNNSHSSNSSTFEKEYETFINRIDLDKECEQPQSQQRKEPIIVSHHSSFIKNNCSETVSYQSDDIKTPPDHIIAHKEMINMNDCTQNHDFTTAYKKKRMLIKDENEGEIKTQPSKEFKSNIGIETTKNTDAMPKLSTAAITTKVILQKRYRKARRNIPVNLKRRRTHFSQLYKIFKRRRLRANTTTLVQKHIAMLKERHLPLIKRQSFKNYSSCDKVFYNPSSLMHLTVSFVNTAAYQEQLLFERDIVLNNNCSKNYGEERKDCQKIHTKDITNTRMQYSIKDEYNLRNVGTTVVGETTLKNDGGNIDKGTEKEFEESNSNSLNGTASLKEQEDFNGFEEQQISENFCAEENVLHYIESSKKSENFDHQELSKTEEHNYKIRAATTTAIQMTERQTTSIETTKTIEFLRGDCIMEVENLECTLRNVKYLKHDKDDDNIRIENSDKMVKDSLQLISKSIVDEFQISNSVEDIPKNTNDDAISKIQVSSEAEHTLHNASMESFSEENQEHNQSKAFSISSHTSEKMNNPTKTQTLPAMRTKASVKMCDFSNVQPKLRSSKSRSKSKSPISEKSSKLKLKYKKSSPLSCIDKIDKTKFVEKWAESAVPRNFQLLSTKDPEVLDLSSRNLEKFETFHIAEYSSSSVTMSSSANSSSSKSYHKSSTSSSSSSSSSSTSSSSSSSSSSNSTKSFIATHRRDHISTDGSEFNEFKALEKELSQHKNLLTTEGWSQKETLRIAEATKANSQILDTFNVKKTEGNTQTEAQDIAELKKILECEQNEVVDDKSSLQCQKSNHGLMDTGGCSDLISTNQEPESCKNITKAFLANQTLNFNSSRDSISNVKYQKYHNQQHVDEQKQHDVIPKLSDLCEIALNSSFVIKNINCKENEKKKLNVVMSVTNKPIPPKSPVEIAEATEATTQRLNSPSQHCEENRELTVEEALAEMYRQAGVLSDPEGADDGLPSRYGENEAHDFLLVDLAEILESNENENNVFVLQCDMNENLVRVVTGSSQNATTVPSHESNDEHSADDNSVNPLQLVELLTTSNCELISESNAEDLRCEPCSEEAIADSIIIGTEDSYSAISDLPIIHHEEIVPDNYKEFAKKEFIKYLHAKYVQKNVKKFHHANRILKKYRRRFLINKSINYLEATQCSPM